MKVSDSLHGPDNVQDHGPLDEQLENRCQILMRKHLHTVHREADGIFAWILLLQYAAGLMLAVWLTPASWSGLDVSVHPHVWAALLLGFTITALPVWLAVKQPGELSTRLVISLAQILWSALLIHLTQGRIETHFHVFVSLAVLAFYRDWRVLFVAAAVAALDHLVRGLFWPRSVYGVSAIEPWRWIEHTGWVLCEVAFLCVSNCQTIGRMRQVAYATACVESDREIIECQVRLRTTELCDANRKLSEERDRAETALRVRTEFLANMSHEIRTPMTAITGFLEILTGEESRDTATYADAVRTIRRNSDHLLNLISDILDFSKIESGQLKLESVACSPAALAQEVIDLMRHRAEMRGLMLYLDLDSGCPDWIVSDPTRLRQVLINLVGNAIKFTERGHVRLALLYPQPGQLRFEVSDTGIGISAAQIEHLFQPFTQADSSVTRRFGGTGLGLAICRRLVEGLGGSISIESVLGAGSRFRVELPVQATAQPGLPGAAGTPEVASNSTVAGGKVLTGVRVLVADDGADNRKLVSYLLRKSGAEVTLACDGQEALDRIAERSEDDRFHVVLMDMQMPLLDGYSATRHLRETGDQTPVIALTANALSEDRQRCLDAGCSDYLTKPIQRAALLDTVAEWSAVSQEVVATGV